MARNYLEVTDNVIEKQLLVRTKEIGSSFYHAAQAIGRLNLEVIQFYAN